MNLLKKAENEMAFAKIGILGFSGVGKTYTAALIAIGIAKMSGDKRPIAFFDTETGSDWLIPMIEEAGYELVHAKSRAFTDLVRVIDEAEKECSVLISDSMTHVWRDLTESYKTKLNRKYLQFQDWGPIKEEWGKFTDKFVNSKIHFIVCGRAGFEYDYEYQEDGTKDLIKTGTKMKAENEFGFEPSLVIEMEKVTPAAEEVRQIRINSGSAKEKSQKLQKVTPKVGSRFIHRGHILKDRANRINGQFFDNITFDDLTPHFKALNIGGKHLGVDTSRDSGGLFDNADEHSAYNKKRRKQIALEEIKGAIEKTWSGTAQVEKRSKVTLREIAFGTTSETKIETMDLSVLEYYAKLLKWFADDWPEHEEQMKDTGNDPRQVISILWQKEIDRELTESLGQEDIEAAMK